MRYIFNCVFVIFCIAVNAQKELTAIRVAEPISIDGVLDEDAWSKAPVATDFMQLVPTPYVPPTYQTEVKILYTDIEIYVAARLYDKDPGNIAREYALRDRTSNTDWFSVSFDTYQDGINAFVFRVSSAGVQYDSRISAAGEDVTWDAVWESKVGYEDNAWIVEMRIPLNTVRFSKKTIQTWGIQFGREIRLIREESYWNPIKPEIAGRVNQYGILRGIENIKSPIRIFAMPFVTAYHNSKKVAGQPTQSGLAYTGGMDVKYGLNDAYTLDMTLVPDFGQVISDPDILNLTPFEVFFEENRQFFKEGQEIFNKGDLFYTRRVGDRPLNFSKVQNQLEPGERIVDNPNVNQLYNATKLSGRGSSGLGVGVFNALEARRYATVENEQGEQRRIETNPLTNYNVFVLDQNLKNNSFVTLMNTNAMRGSGEYDANVTGLFFDITDNSLTYNLAGNVVMSNIMDGGTSTGYKHSLSASKVSGNWRGGVSYNIETDDYRVNDLGFLLFANKINFNANAGYVQFKSSNKELNRWEINLTSGTTHLYNPREFSDFFIAARSFVLYKTGFAYGGNFRLEPVETYDFFEPRTSDFSQSLAWPRNVGGGAFISTDYRKKFAINVNVGMRGFDQPGRVNHDISFGPRFRFSDKFSLFWTSNYSNIKQEWGWVNKNLAGSLIEGLGSDGILIGTRDRSIVTNQINGQFIFNEYMGFNLRLRHFWSSVTYTEFGRLGTHGHPSKLSFTGMNEQGKGIYDRNFNLFDIDLQYLWRFMPGSDIIFFWKLNVFADDDNFNSGYFNNVGSLVNANRENSFSIRIIYFLDYNKVFG
jgi:hypothetical protein